MNSAPSGWIAGERLLLRGGERVHRIPGDSCFGGGRSYGFEPRYNSRNLGAPKVERLTFFLQVLVLVVYRARHIGLLVVQDPGDHMAGNLHLPEPCGAGPPKVVRRERVELQVSVDASHGFADVHDRRFRVFGEQTVRVPSA